MKGRKEWKIKGLSVAAAAGCTHWAITQRVLGFPSLNRKPLPKSSFDGQIQLITEEDSTRSQLETGIGGIFVIETHPALAIAIKQIPNEQNKWYRHSAGATQEYWNQIKQSWGFDIANLEIPTLPCGLEKNDYVDALVSMILGVKWLQGEKEVKIDGNAENGSFLLPFNKFEWEEAIRLSEPEMKPTHP